MKNGNGKALVLHENNKIKQRYSVANGKYNGLYEEFSNKGILVKSGFYINEKKDSIWTSFYISGGQKKRCGFNLDTLHGEYSYFLENGMIKTHGLFHHGKKEGNWFWNQENGKKRHDWVF